MTNVIIDENPDQYVVELTENQIRFYTCIKTIQYLFAILFLIIFSMMFM